jgi:hypothetical protein
MDPVTAVNYSTLGCPCNQFPPRLLQPIQLDGNLSHDLRPGHQPDPPMPGPLRKLLQRPLNEDHPQSPPPSPLPSRHRPPHRPSDHLTTPSATTPSRPERDTLCLQAVGYARHTTNSLRLARTELRPFLVKDCRPTSDYLEVRCSGG